jgi:hypothetical protein
MADETTSRVSDVRARLEHHIQVLRQVAAIEVLQDHGLSRSGVYGPDRAKAWLEHTMLEVPPALEKHAEPVAVVIDASAVLAYAAGRTGIVDLIAGLEGASFAVPASCMAWAVSMAEPIRGILPLDVERITDHPGAVELPAVTVAEEMVHDATRAVRDGRVDLVAALVTARRYGVPVATYAPDNYEGADHPTLSLQDDGWKAPIPPLPA